MMARSLGVRSCHGNLLATAVIEMLYSWILSLDTTGAYYDLLVTTS